MVVDLTFHNPKDFLQLLIIIFKDIVIAEYLPFFYILITNKTEILYGIIFKSVKRILTKNNIYKLNKKTIHQIMKLHLLMR